MNSNDFKDIIMIIIYNNIIPFKGYLCINICGLLFVKDRLRDRLNDTVINHERIHTAQMREMLYIGFYVWYVIEWIFRLFQHGLNKRAYKNISFEREAFANEDNFNYLKERRHYEQFRRQRV